MRFPDVDWYCDECDAHLNYQSGFDDDRSAWACAECGHENRITADEIFDPPTSSSRTSIQANSGTEIGPRSTLLTPILILAGVIVGCSLAPSRRGSHTPARPFLKALWR